jgi:5-methylcytosine-specific restriction endonuclease McrA
MDNKEITTEANDCKIIPFFEKPPLHTSNKRVVVEKEKWNWDTETYTPENQYKIFTEKDEKSEIYKRTLQQIQRKINGYKHQDKDKGLFDANKFVRLPYVLDLLQISDFDCYYCKEKVKILYEYIRESKQWSLERIDNDIGHNVDNVKIACLHCNLRRKTMYHERYAFTKQLKIVKK